MSIDIYLDDLKPDIQMQVLQALGISSVQDGNYDVLPLFTIQIES